jgi:hypothetical protein
MKNIIVKHGLITVQFNQVSFIHRRFAEFYASKFFVRNLKKIDIEPIFTNVSYQGLTDMIIYAINEKSTLNHIFLKSFLDTCRELENIANFKTSPLSLFARNSETDRKLGDIKTLNDIIEQLKSEKIDLWKFCENIVSTSLEFYFIDKINTRSKKIKIFENLKTYAIQNYGASRCFPESSARVLNGTELKEMEKVGLIYEANGGYEFVHEIFAAYFLTVKLRENISDPKTVKFIGDVVLVDEKYSAARLFADQYLFGLDLLKDEDVPVIFRVIASTSNVQQTMNSIHEKYGRDMIFKRIISIRSILPKNQNILIYLSKFSQFNLPKILNWMRTNIDDLQFLKEQIFCIDNHEIGILHHAFENLSNETLLNLLVEVMNWQEILGQQAISELILMESKCSKNFLVNYVKNRNFDTDTFIKILDILKTIFENDDEFLLKMGFSGNNNVNLFLHYKETLKKLIDSKNCENQTFLFGLHEGDELSQIFNFLFDIFNNEKPFLKNLLLSVDRNGDTFLIDYFRKIYRFQNVYVILFDFFKLILENLDSNFLKRLLLIKNNENKNLYRIFIAHSGAAEYRTFLNLLIGTIGSDKEFIEEFTENYN